MAPRVLVSDKLSETAVQVFRDRGIDVDFEPDVGKDKEKLLQIIDRYDGLAIRSATKVTEKLIAAADNLKVVGPRRHRCRQCRYSGGVAPRHHRHEYAIRQFHHHGRTRDCDAAGR